MPKITDGQFALGGLALFAIWVFVVLPFLYQVPITQKCYGNQPNSTAPYSGGPGDHISAPVATTEQTIPKPNAAAHPSNESEKYSNEFWSAKLTDWLLAAFTLALVFFTGRLYYATAGLFTETAGLREAAAMDAGRQICCGDQYCTDWIPLASAAFNVAVFGTSSVSMSLGLHYSHSAGVFFSNRDPNAQSCETIWDCRAL